MDLFVAITNKSLILFVNKNEKIGFKFTISTETR